MTIIYFPPVDDYDDPANWRLEDSIPGKPESDYPTFTTIPQTSFDCKGQTPGYYADTEARCQVRLSLIQIFD